MPKDRRVENIDPFVVEPFEDCPGNICARILNQSHWTESATRRRRSTSDESVKRCAIAILDNELRAEGRHNVAHVNMPPVGTQGQTFDPFRVVHGTVGPFIRHFRMQEQVSSNAFLHLVLSPECRGICNSKRIHDGREVLRACGCQLSQCRRVKGFSVTAAQCQCTDILGINRLPAHRDLRLLRVIISVCRRLKRNYDCRSIVAVPLLALGEVHLQAIEAGEVPRWAGKWHPYFLVDSPHIAIDPEALPIHRTNRLKRVVERVTIACEPRRVVFTTDREGDRPRGKIKQVTVKGGIVYRQLIFTGILQVHINLCPGRPGIVSTDI